VDDEAIVKCLQIRSKELVLQVTERSCGIRDTGIVRTLGADDGEKKSAAVRAVGKFWVSR
jgi:hypothetical protein